MTSVDVVRDAPRAPLAPVDPNVKLPASARAAVERAEQYYKKPEEPAPAATMEPAVSQPQPGAPVQPASQSAPAQVTGAGNEPVVDPQDATWEHKFKSMQGRFQSSQSQLRSMQEQITEMGNELVASQRRIEELVNYQQQQSQPQQRLVTDQERTDYGDDFLSVAARAAQEALSPEVAALKGEVTELKRTLHQNATQTIYQSLDGAIPNWRIINRHPDFVGWLGLRDPISGGIRKVLLDSAFRAADAARVVAIFRGFVAEDATRRPVDQTPQPPAPGTQAPARQPVVGLETLAAPGRARSSPAQTPAGEKPIYTSRDISAFYQDVRKGVYAGREPEKQAREQDIFAAQREGRVR